MFLFCRPPISRCTRSPAPRSKSLYRTDSVFRILYSIVILPSTHQASRFLSTLELHPWNGRPYRASPVPSPVQRYSASSSRRRWCCSLRSSGTRPLTWARALRITLLKLRWMKWSAYGFFSRQSHKGGPLTWYSVLSVTTQASCARTIVSHALTTLGEASSWSLSAMRSRRKDPCSR